MFSQEYCIVIVNVSMSVCRRRVHQRYVASGGFGVETKRVLKLQECSLNTYTSSVTIERAHAHTRKHYMRKHGRPDECAHEQRTGARAGGSDVQEDDESKTEM